jgi:hypothetical protein
MVRRIGDGGIMMEARSLNRELGSEQLGRRQESLGSISSHHLFFSAFFLSFFFQFWNQFCSWLDF